MDSSSGTGPGRQGAATPVAGDSGLVQRVKRWHAHLRRNVPPGVDPLLRMQQGAAMIHATSGRRIDQGLCVLLDLAGGGLDPPPPGFAGKSLRPKVGVSLQADGGGVRVSVSYYGTVPAARALAQARAAMGETATLQVEEDPTGRIRLLQAHEVQPRVLALVMVEAGGQDFAVPMRLVSEALPAGGCEAPAEPRASVSMAACLGLRAAASVRGRAARLRMTFADGIMTFEVDAVLGHRNGLVYGPGPLLGAIPWLLGVVQGEDGTPVLVVHPRGLLGAASRLRNEPVPANPDLPTGSSPR